MERRKGCSGEEGETGIAMQEREPISRTHPEYQYLDLLREIMERGRPKMSMGGGVEYVEVFGRMHHYDLKQGFPLITTKKVPFRLIAEELLWFLRGDSNIKALVDKGIHIWDEWPYRNYRRTAEQSKAPMMTQDEFIRKIGEEAVDSKFVREWGELGPVYGAQWRKWKVFDENGQLREIDQLAWLISKIARTPERRHAVISTWNPAYIYEMAAPGARMMDLPPCHMIFQVNTQPGDKEGEYDLSLMMTQRSCDMFLGVPFNIASYALLTHMIAHAAAHSPDNKGGFVFRPSEFVHSLGSAHIYANHFDQVREQLKREPRPLPKLWLNPQVPRIDQFTIEDVKLEGYNPHPALKGEIVVVGGKF